MSPSDPDRLPASVIVGIDLGTTHSLAAVFRNGVPELVPNALGEYLTPSAVGLADDGTWLVGAPARERLSTHPGQTVAAFKRYMGTSRKLKVGPAEYRPEELSALVLKSLKADVEALLGHAVEEAVVTVPAYFNDTQRRATRAAGELAGFRVERLLNEPTAAALAYGLHQKGTESQFLVFDLGGGTFDVSILELFSGVMEVRATAGNNALGGEDFTRALAQAFLASAPARDAKLTDQGIVGAMVHAEAERVKKALSLQPETVFRVVADGREITWPVSASEFEAAVQPLIEPLRAPVEKALRDARLRSGELSEIVLVGGATRMPVVRQTVTRLFGRFPNHSIHPDHAIALGAAVQAGLKSRDAALEDTVMTDVCPYTLGTETSETINRATNSFRHGLFLPIIERNTVIPASRTKMVYPLHETQTVVSIEAYQGESRLVADNVFLGKFDIGLPKTGDRGVEIRFTYDVNGLLEVEATVKSTHEKKAIVIHQGEGALSAAEQNLALARLSTLKISPREDAPNATLLARLERLYASRLAEERQWVGLQARAFDDALETQEPRTIAHARDEIGKRLDAFEADSPLPL